MEQITRVRHGDLVVLVLAALIAATAFAARRWQTRRLQPASAPA